jgi:hypothetical protein
MPCNYTGNKKPNLKLETQASQLLDFLLLAFLLPTQTANRPPSSYSLSMIYKHTVICPKVNCSNIIFPTRNSNVS